MVDATLDHLILAATNLEAAVAPFERLGLRLTPAGRRADRATVNRAFFAGSDGAEFYVEILAVDDPAAAQAVDRTRPLRRALDDGRAAFAIALAAADIAPLRAALAARGAAFSESQPRRDDGSILCDLLQPSDEALFGCALSVLRYHEDTAVRYARHESAGQFVHDFPLRRLDHLAIVAHEPSVQSAWTEILGVPVAGTIGTSAFIGQQMTVRGGTVELLSATSPESPMAARPSGLASMAAFEVENLDRSVALARERGFTLPDGQPGPIPGTRTATISPDQLSGLALQLLEYV